MIALHFVLHAIPALLYFKRIAYIEGWCGVSMREDYITDEQVVKRANAAIKLEIERLTAMDAPVIVYDRKKQVVIQRNSDGTEIEVGQRLRKGHYSERVAKKA